MEMWQNSWKDEFSEKLVLIGDETKEADLTYTPFSSTFPGVAVHATVMDNILQGEFVHEASSLVTISLSVCFSGVLAALQLWLFHFSPQRRRRSYQLKVIIGFAAFLCFAFIFVGLNFTMFYFSGLLLSFTLPLIGMLLAWILVTNCSYVEQLKQEYIYRETIIKNMGNGLIVLDDDGKITTLNQEAMQLLNLSEEEFLGKHIKDALWEDLPEIVDEMTRASGPGAGRAGRFSLKIGGRELEVSLSYGEETLDNPCPVIAVITDVSELHNLERSLQLQQRRAAYSQLASELNHRIKDHHPTCDPTNCPPGETCHRFQTRHFHLRACQKWELGRTQPESDRRVCDGWRVSVNR
jgi:PAS domain S-box-containing protein